MFGERADREQIAVERLLRNLALNELVLLGWCECCAYCDEPLDSRTVTIDHAIPRSKGGTDQIDNLVPACHKCNAKKADLTLERFLHSRGWTGPDIVRFKNYILEINEFRLRNADHLIAHLSPHQRIRLGLYSAGRGSAA